MSEPLTMSAERRENAVRRLRDWVFDWPRTIYSIPVLRDYITLTLNELDESRAALAAAEARAEKAELALLKIAEPERGVTAGGMMLITARARALAALAPAQEAPLDPVTEWAEDMGAVDTNEMRGKSLAAATAPPTRHDDAAEPSVLSEALATFSKAAFYLGQWNSMEHDHAYLDELDEKHKADLAHVKDLIAAQERAAFEGGMRIWFPDTLRFPSSDELDASFAAWKKERA